MSGASDFLDPVEAAEDEISRSKRVIASALDDLSQHHSWLESYHRDERRRAQRLRRQEALQRLELRRQRAAWMLRHVAKTSFGAMRTTAVFLARNGAAFLAWFAARAKALTLLALRELSAALSWSWRTGRDLAQRGYEGAATGFAWTVRTSDALGIAFRKRLSTGAALLYAEAATRAQPVLQPAFKRALASWTRTRHRSKRLASTVQTRASDSWAYARSSAPILALNAVTATSRACTRLAEKAVVIGAQGRDQVSIAFGWTVRTSDELGVAFRKRLSTDAALLYAKAATRAQPVLRHAFKEASASWMRAGQRSKRLASTLQNRASDSWAHARSSAPIFALNAVTATSRACTRLAEKAVVIGAQGRDQVSIAFGWTVRTSDELGVAFRKRLSTDAALLYAKAATRAQSILRPAFKRASASWMRAGQRSKRLASTLQTRLSDNWSRTRSGAPILAGNVARAGFKAASKTWSQAALRTRTSGRGATRSIGR